MMLRRRWPKPTWPRSCVQSPSSSGPRCAIRSFMTSSRRARSGIGSPRRLMAPQIPHMASAVVAGAGAQQRLQSHARRRRAASARACSTSRRRCSRIAWRWASTFDWSVSRDIAAEKCSSSSRMKPSATKNRAFGADRMPSCAREHGQRAVPDREAEDHDASEQPQQRVALHQRAPADELEHERKQAEGAEDRDDLEAELHQIPWSAATGAASPGSGTARRRPRPTNRASSTLTM